MTFSKAEATLKKQNFMVLPFFFCFCALSLGCLVNQYLFQLFSSSTEKLFKALLVELKTFQLTTSWQKSLANNIGSLSLSKVNT